MTWCPDVYSKINNKYSLMNMLVRVLMGSFLTVKHWLWGFKSTELWKEQCVIACENCLIRLKAFMRTKLFHLEVYVSKLWTSPQSRNPLRPWVLVVNFSKQCRPSHNRSIRWFSVDWWTNCPSIVIGSWICYHLLSPVILYVNICMFCSSAFQRVLYY